MGREARITSAIKNYDSKLFCKRNTEGKLCVFRDGHTWENHAMDGGHLLRVLRPTPYLILALTDNWSIRGNAVDWGIEPVLARLKKIDGWHNDVVGELEKAYDKDVEATERDMRNKNESFLHDFRGQFAKAFADVNTSTMDKKDLRKKNEKRIKQ